MIFFKKHTGERPNNQNQQSSFIQKHLDRFDKQQRRLAAWMQRKSERLSYNTKLALFSLFVLLTGAYSAYLISSSILKDKGYRLQLTPIRPPAHIRNNGIEELPQTGSSKMEQEKIMLFKHLLDSAKNSSPLPVGQALLDKYQGLQDSLRILEYISQLQLKQ